MLFFTSEYIKALYAEKYLLFLEWVDFIAFKYTKSSELLDTDTMVNLLVYEWMNYGYSEEDARNLVVLFAVYNLESKPLQGKLDYSLNLILGAMFVCMVFQKQQIHITAELSDGLSSELINELIKLHINLVDPILYENSLQRAKAQFFQWVERVDKKEIDRVFQKINAVTKPRYIIEDYILQMEHRKIDNDVFYSSRLSLAKRFLIFLQQQTVCTPQLLEECRKYVNVIRTLHPADWEEAHLHNIAPLFNINNTWQWITGIGLNFFSIVLQEKSLEELINGNSLKST